jgi:ATP-dependent Clp protease ATP-binding subunit ClpC
VATNRYPVLIWRDASGASTAALVGEYESAAASAPTENEALRQLKELLEWRWEHEPWSADPDLTEPLLLEVKVEVRPQYRAGKRMVPCPETVWLRVPCVTGRQESGLRLCVVPHLSLQFNFQDASDVKALVAHYVKEAVQALSPAQLAAQWPPRECRLEEIVWRRTGGHIRRVPPENRPEMKVLFTVADPLLHDHARKRSVSAAYGREALVHALLAKLGNERANVLLVGESGVGKSTVLLDAVKKLARRPNPPSAEADRREDEDSAKDLRAYRFWRGSAGRMIAGMRYLGEWEERCEKFIEQLAAVEGVFCAENLLELVSVGGQGAGDSVAAFLLPYLQRGELRMVAEATLAEVEACRRLLPGLLDIFQTIPVPAFDEATAARVLRQIAEAHATASRLEVEPGAIALAHRLFRRFQPYSAFPGPAANFVRGLCDTRSPRASSGKRSVTAKEVVTAFVQRTGLPELFLRDDLLLSVDDVRERFAAQIIGQPDATAAAARLVTTIKAGLTDPNRPQGVLLFCGPTGVGKTALARSLVDYCFGGSGPKDRLVRLDMSEYSGPGAAQRLLQNAQGQPAPWIERVRRQPFCVVLFDEIEKAAPEVFDVLLSVLDEGRLTDRFGRVTWFRSAIIIMTSNLGANVTGHAGFAAEAGPNYESEVSKFFRPEFFNRLDAVITFNPLGHAEVEAIVRKELSELAAREGLATARLQLQWTEPLVTAIAREGYDHRLGARPLQRALERLVVTPLARWKVANPHLQDATLVLDCDARGCVIVSQEANN